MSGTQSATGSDLPTLPPQYSTGNLGFFTRTTEAVPTSVTVGPDGAIYVGALTGIPYPEGYASVYRIDGTNTTTGFNGTVPSGVPQVFASGFTEIQSVGFDNQGDMYVLEYLNANAIYAPGANPATLPPSQLIKVAPNGVRTTISGPELKLGNYLLVDKATGDVYVAINNANVSDGEVLRYHTDPKTGVVTHTVVASHLNDPRGLAFGPDGNLYVLEQGDGAGPAGTKTSVPVIPFIPGQVSEKGGYTGSITRVDITSPAGGQQRIFTGLPSFEEFDPTTGQNRVISVGPNGFTIGTDGTVYIASGGGLAPQTAAAVGSFADDLQGVLAVKGLFGTDPSKATVTPAFNSLTYAAQNGPDGATTEFNTESNLNDITVGPNGDLYAVDAARNDLYTLSPDGKTVLAVTVLQKQPPVLTPPQYAAVAAAGGDPTAQYQAEITSTTTANANDLPNVPGTLTAKSSTAKTTTSSSATASTTTTPATSTPTAATTTGAPTKTATGASTSATAAPPPHGEDTTGSGVTSATPTAATAVTATQPLPGPTDPVSPPVLPNNIYASSFAPFFGNLAPAPSDPLVLPAGAQGSYTVSNVIDFGDRLADDGSYDALLKALKLPVPATAAPYSSTGDFTDGAKWTTDLAQILGAQQTDPFTDFAYEDATAHPTTNPLDPLNGLLDFQEQINLFKATDVSFKPTDLVTVTFGGNDLTPATPTFASDTIALTVKSIISGMTQLAALGAKHFLVSNSVDVTLAPLFSEPAFLQAAGATKAQFETRVNEFNKELSTALTSFQKSTGLDVKTLDLHSLFNGIVANPSDYGFTNVTQPILANPPTGGSTPTYNPAIVGQDPQVQHSSLFLDPYFDPTALGQTLIAQTARSTLV